ncbi:MAG: hypothetical protein AB9869_01265 [Verrucomicrobiia bacterium]
MPTQYGLASVYGVDGTVTHTGAAAAYVIPDSVEGEHGADIEEFRNGYNQLIGFHKSNERVAVNLTLIPKAATLANADKGLAYPAIPSKVTLDGFVESGDGTTLDGDYIYVGGASRTVVRGQASLRLPIFRPLNLPSGVTITTLVTAISA